jgi:hypothetical protein
MEYFLELSVPVNGKAWKAVSVHAYRRCDKRLYTGKGFSLELEKIQHRGEAWTIQEKDAIASFCKRGNGAPFSRLIKWK